MRTLRFGLSLLLLAACTSSLGDNTPPDATSTKPTELSAARPMVLSVRSAAATRIEAWLYDGTRAAVPKMKVLLDKSGDSFGKSLSLAQLAASGLGDTVYYGYRAWGSNWPYVQSWTPGSADGFVTDVDTWGSRFNPNKLLFDPAARELSHDPEGPTMRDGTVYGTGPTHRLKDSGPVAPKSVWLSRPMQNALGSRPSRAITDDVFYEVHVRGLTQQDASVPAALRGTYAGAALKAAYLKSMGITAIEFLPVQETQNDQNDISVGTEGDNYWGYMTLGYFAPDRRYASDKSPGGPTREFQAMAKAFHDQGIKVVIDVVYNHTAEGGTWGTPDTATLLSFRGLDNASYYERAGTAGNYYDNTGIGANVNVTSKITRDFVIDSLKYWKEVMGVDGFRFDLASVLGNACDKDCYRFDGLDASNILNRAVAELPARAGVGQGEGAGVDLIAEPWAIGDGTYQVGGFPRGWSEWNGSYRDAMRASQNQRGFANVSPARIASAVAGSSELYADDGRTPAASVNFLVAHDGLTLADLYRYNSKQNTQPWPFGPSDGGEDNNHSWDQGGDAALQRQAARTGLALLAVSAGAPMITGGDEFLRTQRGNNNAYNLDSLGNWLDWTPTATGAAQQTFSKAMFGMRAKYKSLRPQRHFAGQDRNGDGVADVTWLQPSGALADTGYMTNASNAALAWRIDAAEAGDGIKSIYIAYNASASDIPFVLPAARSRWVRVADTQAYFENGAANQWELAAEQVVSGNYGVKARSLVVLIEP